MATDVWVIVKTRRRIGRSLVVIGVGEISKEFIRVTMLLILVSKDSVERGDGARVTEQARIGQGARRGADKTSKDSKGSKDGSGLSVNVGLGSLAPSIESYTSRQKILLFRRAREPI